MVVSTLSRPQNCPTNGVHLRVKQSLMTLYKVSVITEIIRIC